MPVRLLHSDRLISGNLNKKGILAFNATNDEFELRDPSELEAPLLESIDNDNDISDKFVQFLNENINIDNIEIRNFDAGSF